MARGALKYWDRARFSAGVEIGRKTGMVVVGVVQMSATDRIVQVILKL